LSLSINKKNPSISPAAPFYFRVINTESNELLLQKPMTILSAATGRAKVEFDGSELLDILAQPASYSIQRTQPGGGYSDAVFVDAQAGARAPIDIVDSVLPQYVPSVPLTIPNTELSNQFSYEGVGLENYAASPYWQGNPNGSNNWNSWVNPQFYSSFIEPRSAVTTIQMYLVGYTGTIKAQPQTIIKVFFTTSANLKHTSMKPEPYTGTLKDGILWYAWLLIQACLVCHSILPRHQPRPWP
jgi:hypothetical protein